MSKKVLGNTDRGLLFVVSAPAGTGKSTMVDMLIKEFPDGVVESCSSTTRRPRPGEVPKHHYLYLSIAEFEEKIAKDEFLEHVKLFGNYYGTRREEIDSLQASGKHVVLVIDTQGALQLKEKLPEAIFIFISPPSVEELRNRLFKRRTEDEEMIEERLDWSKNEIALARHYDYQITNDNLEISYQVLRSILIAEEHKNRGTI
ncbi:MAG: Guanylate kinase [Chlamydiae bacterium]|nr:Guanylate kinase [Chlamydiota bacterium]